MLDESAANGTTWTAPALCDWLRAERGVEISADWQAELLHRDGFRSKRTRDSLRHRADPSSSRPQGPSWRTYGITAGGEHRKA
ncbi:winged helix-turn-helix domain-containing protein [Streptomyces sp. NPDC051561]|uniref:winged helix-turn-helix domain-containing protein n=1 Tax=Streptomyces sp. NPDC051561 TaxID=3365658 RepID=UPI0037BA9C1C